MGLETVRKIGGDHFFGSRFVTPGLRQIGGNGLKKTEFPLQTNLAQELTSFPTATFNLTIPARIIPKIEVNLPPHGTSAADFLKVTLNGKPGCVVMLDNGKEFRLPDLKDRPTQLSAILDHHLAPQDVLPENKGSDGKLLVGAELVLTRKDELINIFDYCGKENIPVLVAPHGDPYDPDSAIFQYLVAKIANGSIGKGKTPAIYEQLAQYAKVTDYYTFPFSSTPEFTLKGLIEGLAITHKGQDLVRGTNELLDFVVENNLNPNEYAPFVSSIIKYSIDNPDSLVAKCSGSKRERLIQTRNAWAKAFSDNVVAEIDLQTQKGVEKFKVVFVDSSNAKEIDDIYCSELERFIVIKPIKDSDGKVTQYWVVARPTNYIDGNGIKKSESPLSFVKEKPDWPWAQGYIENIVTRLQVYEMKKGRNPKVWARWPYYATATQGPLPVELSNVDYGKEIIEALKHVPTQDELNRLNSFQTEKVRA